VDGRARGALADRLGARQAVVQRGQREYSRISQLSLNAVKLFYDTAESKEGVRAFSEKRKPDFHKYVK